MMTDQDKVRSLLAEQPFMVIAVVLPDGNPWATPVKIQMQDGRCFEWDSRVTTEHSKAIAANSAVAASIFDTRPNGQVGIYISGTATLVEEKTGGMGRYRITAERLWLNDDSFIKREVSLD